MRRSKILVCLMLALVLVVGMASSAMAASFYFKFDPDVIRNANYTDYERCDGTKTAYVDPGTSVSTAYQLKDTNKYVSNAISSTGSRKSFTYKPDYGREGDRYLMMGAPNVSDYAEYHVSGTWKP